MKGESIRQRIERMREPMSDDELLGLRAQLETRPNRGPVTRYLLGKAHQEIDERGLND